MKPLGSYLKQLPGLGADLTQVAGGRESAIEPAPYSGGSGQTILRHDSQGSLSKTATPPYLDDKPTELCQEF